MSAHLNATKNGYYIQQWKWNVNVNMNQVCVYGFFIVFHLDFYFVGIHTILSGSAEDTSLLLGSQKLTSHFIEWTFLYNHCNPLIMVASQALQSCPIGTCRSTYEICCQLFSCLAAACYSLEINRCTCSHKQTIQMLIHKQIVAHKQ